MQKRKIHLLFYIILAFCFSIGTNSLASVNLPDIYVSLQIDNNTMKVNGKNQAIDIDKNTKPVILKEHTLVPIRAIIEAFGGTVSWNEKSKTAEILLDGDKIELRIDSKTAYLNEKKKTLEVAPTVINNRTMIPLRFVAEGFNLGVGWDSKEKIVYIIRNSFDSSEYESLMKVLPEYSGNPFVYINDNIPYFKDYEKIKVSFEYYSKLDTIGRCDVCMASVGKDIMPTEKRGSISSVIPTGWVNAEYGIISGKYLYNRCHLIGYQLTGENANEKNLITGTRYLNVDGMLPFENRVNDYIDKTGDNVIYRVTPVFTRENLVADGVLIEAMSAKDSGKSLEFCVFCYNVQPQIEIDYKTGKSRLLDDEKFLSYNYCFFKSVI